MDAIAPGTSDELGALLNEVAERGAPAQQEHARALIDRLHQAADSTAPIDGALLSEALLLVDAYRNDPYLWR